jgi:methyl-accepting chemotaxis protein
MFSSASSQQAFHSEQTADATRQAGPTDSELAAAIETLLKGGEAAALGPEVRRAVLGLLAKQSSKDASSASLLAEFSSEVSATGTNIGWITYDVQQVAENSEAISGAITELAESIGQISETSQSSASDATRVRDGVEDNISVMRETGEAMRQISEQVGSIAQRCGELDSAVRQISEMAGTIESISRQTNLLALNATIEAARAGTAGRGFAVVADEVKKLSGDTAKATEDIRSRLTLLSQGMEAIRQVTSESVSAVSLGEEKAQLAQQKAEGLGEDISAIAERMHQLADHIMRQEQASSEISTSVSTISEKAKKLREEISLSLSRLVKAEEAALASLSEVRASGQPEGVLIALKGETSSWKRRAAATLVCLEPLSKKTETFGDGYFKAWTARISNPQLTGHPMFSQMVSAHDTAHSKIKEMLECIERHDYGAGTQAYMDAEGAIDKMVEAAETLRQTCTTQAA